MTTTFPCRSVLVFTFLAALVVSTTRAAEIVLDSPFESDPAFDLPGTVKTLSPEVKQLWYEVLDAPETELTMRAAEAIAEAHAHELDDLSDAAPPLQRVLERDDLPLAVRLAVVRALITIDARGAADDLWRELQHGEREMRQLVEPALANWNDEPIRKEWLARLADRNTPIELQRLAVRGLGTVREPAALAPLKALVESKRTPAPLRLEAARAIGEIASSGEEAFAGKLAADTSPRGLVERLMAASILTQHRSDRTTAMLKTLALDEEPAVAAIALQTLLETDPKLVVPLTERLLPNVDAKIRRLAARALVEVPSPEAVASLGPLLDDPHPGVRRYVRDSLFTLAEQPALEEPVRNAGMEILGGDSWRGLEQASLLLGALDHEPAADRLLELLVHERSEVMIAAAWGLRKLALPETLDPIHDVVGQKTELLMTGAAAEGTTEQVAQAFQMFGQMNYAAADPLLRRYVPKKPQLGVPARMAAIWSLGHLHAGRPDEQLVTNLQSRLRDIASMEPESDQVRGMSAITLGRMQADAALPALREFDAPSGAVDDVGASCNWAVTQITGETYPKAKAVTITESGWFLEPLPTRPGDGEE